MTISVSPADARCEFVGIGDSRTCALGDVLIPIDPAAVWFAQLQAGSTYLSAMAANPVPRFYNEAHDGYKTSDVIAQIAAGTFQPNSYPGLPVWASVWVGVNNILTGGTPEQAWADLCYIWSYLRSIPLYKTIAWTVLPTANLTFRPAFETLNRLITLPSESWRYDYLMRPEEVIPIDAANDAAGQYFEPDGVHPNALSETLLAAAMDRLITPGS